MRKMLRLPLIAALFFASVFPSLLPPGKQASAAEIMVPVVLYHVVSDTPTGRYQISVAKFKEQMHRSNNKQYQTIKNN